MFKVNSKDTRSTSLTQFWRLYCFLWTYVATFSSFPIVDFEQVKVCCAALGNLDEGFKQYVKGGFF